MLVLLFFLSYTKTWVCSVFVLLIVRYSLFPWFYFFLTIICRTFRFSHLLAAILSDGDLYYMTLGICEVRGPSKSTDLNTRWLLPLAVPRRHSLRHVILFCYMSIYVVPLHVCWYRLSFCGVFCPGGVCFICFPLLHDLFFVIPVFLNII